ncbi:hypothetical protein [Azospirillum thermophilum]|uniref:hypothetical protein n=1 Tax=Azospirillum thermophilum TaxID=2202148 RepID=UPI001B3BDB47|nr:hypothetical protein [Azospirillum thermophilum]
MTTLAAMPVPASQEEVDNAMILHRSKKFLEIMLHCGLSGFRLAASAFSHIGRPGW